jgi:hypothetical protein
VENEGGRRLLRNIGLQAGQAIDLGWVKLRQDALVMVRIIVVWAIRDAGNLGGWPPIAPIPWVIWSLFMTAT